MNTRKLFGTSIRDVVPRDLSPDSCCQVTIAIGATPSQSSTVCVTTDTRISDELISKGTELVRSLVEADW
ncbi:MAG: hypothetical protein E3J50_05210 [Dehalococcoidia bacterium]|jgi:phosphomannomutase|nr:MAG: hypothetical protein E3J50_05210 [Dehalococcoidia bacterium]